MSIILALIRMGNSVSISTSTQDPTTMDIATVGTLRWRIEAKRTLTMINKLKENVHDSASELEQMTRDHPKLKLIQQKQALREVGRDLRLAQNSFDEQVKMQAEILCRPLCELANERLPQEIRDMLVRHLIEDDSVTFFLNKDNKLCLVNGASNLQHIFEERYTGIGLQMNILKVLLDTGVRFDFRARHELLGKVVDYYAAFGIHLPPKIKSLSLVLIERHMKEREFVLAQLERLTELSKDADVLVIVEVGQGTKARVIHRVRRVLRMIFPLLTRLHEPGIYIHVVFNPSYDASRVKNGSDDTFSIAHYGPWRHEMTPENADFTVEGFEHRLRTSIEEQANIWDLRLPP
ncbi:hypothetical protein ACET3X_001884 [Alternaria dauci]|uniref:Uncharacterized protein n=1 Tax=Alternaria dauci TaxID=48095 RepID=A0ABR3UYY9_9PLEO